MSTPDPIPDRPSPEGLFHQARALSPAEREVYLAQACGGNQQLRERVEALLRADGDAGGFMQTSKRARSTTEPASIAERPGQVIGRYKLLQLIGEGGFGTVFMAEQDEPVRRRVALKIIKPGMDSRMVAARFEAERQALALMDHPHIARVLDGGVTESAMGARPYFVMEYVIGDSITKFADVHRLSIEDRLNLFTQVCEAVQHAHTKGIIHRDLKPGNVLVSMVDGRPFAKVIDFGIAKSLASRLTEKTLFTEHRQLIGTPEYMSPEQAEGSPDIDTRTDVYGLGVLLYELLTGLTPFDAARLRSAAFAEMQRIIKEEDPPAPSVKLSRDLSSLAAAAASRRSEPSRLGQLIRGELDWIVIKAMDKERGRRYESASALAADVRRHLGGEAVVAAPPRAGYRVKKFVSRNRTAVVAAGAVITALVAGAGMASWGLLNAHAANRRLSTTNAELESATQAARLAEARIVVGAFERQDAGGADEAYLATLDLQGAAATLARYLGESDAEAVNAESLLAWRTLEGELLIEKLKQLSARRGTAGGPVMGIDISLWSSLAGEYWNRRDLPACLECMHRVGRHLRDAYARDARNCDRVVYTWIPANWNYWLDQAAVDARAGELEGLSLASLYRVLAAHGEDAERLGAIERAEALDAGAERSPHPANVALRAELAMRDETAVARALASGLLDEADRLAAATAWVGDAECRYWLTRARNIVQARPTPEQQLDAERTQRRLAEASATLEVALQYGYGKKLQQDLEWIYRTRLELLGPGHTATLEGAQCLTLLSCSPDHGINRDRAMCLHELGAEVDAYYANGGAGCWKAVRLDALLSFEDEGDEADGRRRLARAAEVLPGLVAQGDWQALQDEFYRRPGEAGSEFEMELAYFPTANSSELYSALAASERVPMEWRRRWLGHHWGPVVRGYLTWYYRDQCLSPEQGAETYEHAERQLTHVNRCFGENAAAMEGIALARMRLKRYADALDSAAGAAALCAREGRSVTATIVAVEAMANIGMGRAEPAQQSLARLRALAADPRCAEEWPDARALLIEAEAIVGDRGR